MKVYFSEQRVHRLTGPESTYGWLIEAGGSERSVHPFGSPEARRLFAVAVAQVSGITAPAAAERLAAALALRTWGDHTIDRAWVADDLVPEFTAEFTVVDYQRLLYLRDLARNWCPAGNAAARDMNVVALRDTLAALAAKGITGPRQTMSDLPGPAGNRIER